MSGGLVWRLVWRLVWGLVWGLVLGLVRGLVWSHNLAGSSVSIKRMPLLIKFLHLAPASSFEQLGVLALRRMVRACVAGEHGGCA